MTNKKLQALRKMLFLDTSEAAECVGGVSVRTWQRWEKGDFDVPDDVEARILEANEKRLVMIDEIDTLLKEQAHDEFSIDYYVTAQEYAADHRGATALDWRIAQSVAAYYYSEQAGDIN